MKVKRIAAFVLILYAAIFVALAFHNHLTEHPGKHCNACQTVHTPGHAPAITTYSPLLITQAILQTEAQVTARTLLVSSNSERAPPAL